MKCEVRRGWFFSAICTTSLLVYLFLSHGLHFWLSSWGYYRDLLVGLSSFPNSIWTQILNQSVNGVAWHSRWLLQILVLLGMSFLLSFLTWRVFVEHLSFLISAALFVPASFIVPQTLIAFLIWPDGRGRVTFVNQFAILCIAAVCLMVWLLLKRRNPSSGAQWKPTGTFGLSSLAFILPTGIVVMTAIFASIGNDPGFDAGAYHLPLAISYANSNSIQLSEDITFNYPSNAESAIRWFLSPGNDRLASLPSVFSALLIVLIIYRLSCQLGARRQSALIAACCATTFPLLPYLATIPSPDLVGIASMLSAMSLLILVYQTNCRIGSYIAFVGLAIGLAIGARFSLLPAAAFMTVAFCVILVRNDQFFLQPPRFVNWFWVSRSSLLFAIGILVGGGFWYVRASLLHGNPFYPVGILGLAGLPLNAISTVYGTISQQPWLIWVYPWTEVDYTYIYDTGVGAVFTAIIVPGMIWWSAFMIRNWRAQANSLRFERVLVYLCVLFCGLYFLSRPSAYTRHAAFGILLSFFLVAELWEQLRNPLFRTVLVSGFLLMCFAMEKSLAGAVIYRLARPVTEGASRFGLPPGIDKLPPSRIFNAATRYVTYGCMGNDYRHQVFTLFHQATPQDIRRYAVDYLLISEKQKPLFEKEIRLELEESAENSKGADTLSLYRVLRN